MKIYALLWLSLFALAAGSVSFAQAAPGTSPRATTSLAFANGKKIAIEYARVPRPQGKVFGGAIPFDQVWATGDGVATSIQSEQEIRFPEGSIQKGHFSLYLRPSATQWLLMVNQKTGQDATEFPANFEYARFKLNHRRLPASTKPVQQLTITLKKLGPRSGRLIFAFDRSELWADFNEGNGKAHIHGEKEDDDD